MVQPTTLAHEDVLSALASGSRDHYIATLLMPTDVQCLAALLFSYHLEVSAIARQVSEPMAGAIRLRWWADVFEGQRREEAQANPLAVSLLQELARVELSPLPLAEKAVAHEFDLFAEPMESRAMLEGYGGATRSVLFQMIGLGLSGEGSHRLADAAGHAGVSTAIIALLFDLERTRGRGQITVPQDLLRAVGLSDADYLSAEPAALAPALSAMIDLGLEHHAKAAEAIAELPTPLRSVFRLCTLSRPYLEGMAADGSKGKWYPQALGAFRRQWLMWRGRY